MNDFRTFRHRVDAALSDPAVVSRAKSLSPTYALARDWFDPANITLLLNLDHTHHGTDKDEE